MLGLSPRRGLLAAVAAMCGACGGRVVVDASRSAAGAGGASSSSSGTGTSGTGGTSGAGGMSGTGGAGGVVFCMVPSPSCGPAAFCSWADESCGGTDGPGRCAPRPGACGKNFEPTCGCDGMVYDNPCLAQLAGADVDALGGCKPPPGTFGCGAHFCALDTTYCKRVATTNTASCEPVPPGCGGTASCDCLTTVGVECIGTCLSTMDGGILLACQKP